MDCNNKTSWMILAQPGNRQGTSPARMVGLDLCFKKRGFSRDAEKVETVRGRVHGWTLPPPILLCLFFALALVQNVRAETKVQSQKSEVLRDVAKEYRLTGHRVEYKEEVKGSPEEWEAARGLESILIDQMIQEMRKTVHESDIVPVSHGEKIYRQMLDSEYAKQLSQSGGVGIAEMVVAEMRRKK